MKFRVLGFGLGFKVYLQQGSKDIGRFKGDLYLPVLSRELGDVIPTYIISI